VVSRRAFGMVEPRAEGNSLEELHLKEFNRPVLGSGDFAVAGRDGEGRGRGG